MSMRHLRNLGSSFKVSIPQDVDGFLGRECPQPECKGYFKITPGTGLQGATHCICPYCGFKADTGDFSTQEQIEYAKSVVINKVTEAVIKDLKTLEFNHKPKGTFGIGLSLKVTGKPSPIRQYREKQLETITVCQQCSLRYAVYGVFAFCPDCGAHNSLQILRRNLELAAKETDLAKSHPELSEHLIGDALENVISAFDGFGRECCMVNAAKATKPSDAKNMSFQNLVGARKRMQEQFNLDIGASLTASEWEFVTRCFQKRHLLAHKMGVIDAAYVQAVNDPGAIAGRKISITAEEVNALAVAVEKLAAGMLKAIQ